MNRQDIAHQVSITLGDFVEDFDIDAIVADLGEAASAADCALNSIDDIDSETYWAIVEKHDLKA